MCVEIGPESDQVLPPAPTVLSMASTPAWITNLFGTRGTGAPEDRRRWPLWDGAAVGADAGRLRRRWDHLKCIDIFFETAAPEPGKMSGIEYFGAAKPIARGLRAMIVGASGSYTEETANV